MKNSILFIILGVFIISCSTDSKNTMTVSGNIKGLKKGTLYLQYVPDTVLTTLDSLKIEGDGAFKFKTEVESPEIFYLYLKKNDHNDYNDRITFFGEPGNITINTHWNTFDATAKITGSKTNKKLEEYRKVRSKFNARDLDLIKTAVNPELQIDSLGRDSIQKLRNKNLLRSYLYSLNFALNNKDSYIAPYIAITEVPNANVKYLDSINNSLPPEVANSKYGRELKEHIKELRNKGQ